MAFFFTRSLWRAVRGGFGPPVSFVSGLLTAHRPPPRLEAAWRFRHTRDHATMNNLPSAVQFGDQSLSVVSRNGAPWLMARDLARALGYSDERAVNRLYARHAAEFSRAMTCGVKLTPQGESQQREVRIFSPRGCHLLAMFANTDRAASFRRWVLDVLEGIAPVRNNLPAVQAERRHFTRRGYSIASFGLFNQYMRAHQAAIDAGEEPPPAEDVSADVLNGFVTSMLWGRRWVLDFDEEMQPRLRPL